MEQTVKTALLAELLGDVDKLLQRLETVDQQLTVKMEEATSEAAARTYTQLRLSLERTITEHRRTLIAAGNHAAGEIEQQLRRSELQLGKQAQNLLHELRWWLPIQAIFGLLCGFIGGVGSTWLAGGLYF